jgi:hypothetical protein
METDNYFVTGFDATSRYFSFLFDVYMVAKGVFFPILVTFVHTNSEKADEKKRAWSLDRLSTAEGTTEWTEGENTDQPKN